MLKINNNQMDLIVQTEENTNIQKLFDKLSLDINEILIICPKLFFQRFIQVISEDLEDQDIIDIEDHLINDNPIRLLVSYKNKDFKFHFIILHSEVKIIKNPFGEDVIYKVGLKEVKI